MATKKATTPEEENFMYETTMSAVKKKKPAKRKMDKYFVSSQKWELQYIAKKFDTTVDVVRNLRNSMTVGKKSRRKVYDRIRDFMDNTSASSAG